MIDFIKGSVININGEENYVVIENNNIGYRVYTSITSMLDMEVGQKRKFYTQLYVRDDSILVYGFSTRTEMDMFKLLLKVSSIGPKTGLNILSTITPEQIKLAIHNRDYKTLCKAPGIGKKTAERMVLELKDKVGEIDEIDIKEVITSSREYDEAMEALISLGYMKYEVEKVMKNIEIKNLSTEEIIKKGLNLLSES